MTLVVIENRKAACVKGFPQSLAKPGGASSLITIVMDSVVAVAQAAFAEEEMQQESIVREVAIVDAGEVHRASYFVENGTLHAHVGGRVIRLSIGADHSELTVRRLLAGHVQIKDWKRKMAERWAK